MNAGGVARWLWGATAPAALARLPLVPLSLAYGATMRLRAAAYAHGRRPVERLSLPTIAVGNLSVGGAGKTPLAAWIAASCAARGAKPGILLRGYGGGDEALVHRRLVPEAVVVADPDRGAGAGRARAAGATVLVLDDAFQLLGVARDLNVLVVSAESASASRWVLPAGPWREGWNAVARADWIVVTRKRTSAEAALSLATRLEGLGRGGIPAAIASLSVERLEGLESGAVAEAGALRGRRVVAAAGIADPDSFAAQLAGLGARVQLMAYQDHQRYASSDVERLVRAAQGTDYVVVTEKDAVKLRGRWPARVPEPLVAALAIRWERAGREFEEAVARTLRESGAPRP